MPPKTATASKAPTAPTGKRKSQRKWRKKQEKNGLKQVSIYVPEDYAEKLKAFARLLKDGGRSLPSYEKAFKGGKSGTRIKP